MQLSDRLRKVADFVTDGSRVADIGTDHGYIPIDLVESGRIQSALALDIGRGPLMRAEEHIQAHGLASQIETRLSDGVKELKKGEADSIVIAGMGGALTVRILGEGSAVLEDVKEIILSPHTELFLVRRYLIEHGYDIVREEMVYDMGKYYTVMRAVHTADAGVRDKYAADGHYYIYGRLLLEEMSPVFVSYIKAEREKLREVLKHLEGSSNAAEKRAEVIAELEYIDSVLSEKGGF